MSQNFLPQELPVEVGVYLGGRDTFVPQHLLDGPQVGPSLEQVGGKGMTQGMGAHFLADIALFAGPFHDIKHHDPGHFGAPPVQEENIFTASLDIQFLPVGQVEVYLVYGILRDGDQPAFLALALYDNVAIGQVEVRDAQPYQLRHPQATTIQSLDDGPVATILGSRQIKRLDHAIYLIDGEYIGQFHTQFGGLDQFRGVVVDQFLHFQEAEKRLDPRNDAGL